MNQEDEQHQAKSHYKNPLEEQLHHKTYYRLMSFFFAVFIILGIMQTYHTFKDQRDKALTFL